MTESEHNVPLSDDEYARVMHVSRRRSSDAPSEIDDRLLLDRLVAVTASDYQERAAYNYAAQTVVAHALGCPVTEVVLRDDGSTSLRWSHTANISSTPQVRLNELLAFATMSSARHVAEQVRWQYARPVEPALVAGLVDQLRAFTEGVRPVPGDVQRALAYIKGQTFLNAAATILEQQESAAEAIVLENWDVVEVLAQILREEGRIDGRELQQVLGDIIVRGPEGLNVPDDS